MPLCTNGYISSANMVPPKFGALAILVSLRAILSLASIRLDASLEIFKEGAKQIKLLCPDLARGEALRRARLANDLA